MPPPYPATPVDRKTHTQPKWAFFITLLERKIADLIRIGGHSSPMRNTRLIVGVSGATGSMYAIRVLEALRPVPNVETHLVMSNAGKRTLLLETDHVQD